MDAAERKAKLKEIMADEANICRTGIPIYYRSNREIFNAYRIPLEYLVYNPYNGRIGSVVKSYERMHQGLNPENQEDKKIIEKFLWDSNKDANKTTMRRLLEEGQQLHGIVTADGMIVDGNRRASLLNRIRNDSTIEYSKKSHCDYFIAIILPEDAQKKEILALETFYQMGEDAKVDYDAIEKYLKCKDLTAAGFDIKSIAEFMGTSEADIKRWLSAMKLMDEYLDTYGYEGMYTQLEKREDTFLNLDRALKSYKKGIAVMREYDEEDLADLKQIGFDYIRLSMESQAFRPIVAAPSRKNPVSSFFSQKSIWENFSNQHFETLKNIQEESVEDLMKRNPPDLSAALKQRDAEWAEKVGEALRANYKTSLDELDNASDAHQPLKQLIKACRALDAVKENQPEFMENEEIAERIAYLESKLQHFKEILGL